MSGQDLEHIDDEQLLSMYDSTQKLLQLTMEKEDSPIRHKIPAIQRKLLFLEEELRMRSLWEEKK